MIAFELTPEQQLWKEKAGRFAEEAIRPAAAKHDRDGIFPVGVMQKAHREGFLTPLIPKEYGVQGQGIVDNCIIARHLLRELR
jgi:acyl-CoA dehydrogenase